MAIKLGDRGYRPGTRDFQEWQVFNRLRSLIDSINEDLQDIDISEFAKGRGTPTYIARWIQVDTLGDSIAYDTGTAIGVGTTGPSDILMLEGTQTHMFGLERNRIENSDGQALVIIAGGTTDRMVKLWSVSDGGTGYAVGDTVYLAQPAGGNACSIEVTAITAPYGIHSVEIHTAGSGYPNGKREFTVDGGTGGVILCTVSSGAVSAIDSIVSPGSGYSATNGVDIDGSTINGSGAKINILSVNGAITSGTIVAEGSKYSTGAKSTTTDGDWGSGAVIWVSSIHNAYNGNGGNLILAPGWTTGTGISSIEFWTVPASEIDSRDDNEYVQRGIIAHQGYFGWKTLDPVSYTDFTGSLGRDILTWDEDVSLDDDVYTMLVDASLNSVTVTLPDASEVGRRIYRIKAIDIGEESVVKVVSAGGDIDDIAAATGITYEEEFQQYEFHSDGVQWWITGAMIPHGCYWKRDRELGMINPRTDSDYVDIYTWLNIGTEYVWEDHDPGYFLGIAGEVTATWSGIKNILYVSELDYESQSFVNQDNYIEFSAESEYETGLVANVYNAIDFISSDAVGSMACSINLVRSYGTVFTAASIVGIVHIVDGAAEAAFGAYFGVEHTAGTVETIADVYIESTTESAASHYGIYINDISGATYNWSIYSDGGNAYFKDYLGINVEPLSYVDVDGSLAVAIITEGDLTLSLDDSHYTILCDSSSNDVTITLPDASTCPRRIYRIKAVDITNTVKVVSAGGDIDDVLAATGITYEEAYDSYEFQSDGVQWWIVGNGGLKDCFWERNVNDEYLYPRYQDDYVNIYTYLNVGSEEVDFSFPVVIGAFKTAETSQIGVGINLSIDPDSASNSFYGTYTSLTVDEGNTESQTSVIGHFTGIYADGTGDLPEVLGYYIEVGYSPDTTVGAGLYVKQRLVGAGVVTTLAGLYIEATDVVLGTATNHYGIYIDSIADGTDNWAIYSVAGKSNFNDAIGIGLSASVNDDILSTLDVVGSIGHSINTFSSTDDLDENYYSALVDASAGAVTLTLPDATTCARRIYRVKALDVSNTVKVVSAGGAIDGTAAATGVTLSAQYQTYEFHSDGTQWWLINSYYTDEMARDAVGAIVDDTYNIDMTYTDDGANAGTIKAIIKLSGESSNDLLYFNSSASPAAAWDRFAANATGTTKYLSSTSGSLTWETATGYTDENARDAIGDIVTDSYNIDFTYTDAGDDPGTITAIIGISGQQDNDLLFYDLSNTRWDRLAHGSDDTYLHYTTALGLHWSTISTSDTYGYWTLDSDTASPVTITSHDSIDFDGINGLVTAHTGGPDAYTLTIGHSTTGASNLSSDNSNGTVIQDISLTIDSWGHVTAASVGTVDLDSRYDARYLAFKTIAIGAVNGYSWGTSDVVADSYADTLTLISANSNLTIQTDASQDAILFTVSVGTHNLLDGSVHPDTTSSAATAGDLIYANSDGKWDDLAIGTADYYLKSVGGYPAWAALPSSDNYQYWTFAVDGTTKDNITSADILNFVSGTGISITRSADDTITFTNTGIVGIGSGTQNYVTKWATTTTLGDSIIRDDGSSLGILTAPVGDNALSISWSDVSHNSKGLYVLHSGATSGNAYSGYFEKTGASAGTNIGVYAVASGATTDNFAFHGSTSGGGARTAAMYLSNSGTGTENFVMCGSSTASSGASYGGYFTLSGAATSNIAVYAKALNATSNWAFYGEGGYNYFSQGLKIGGSEFVPGGLLTLAAGTTTIPPILLTTGTVLSSALSGAFEWDGSRLYVTQASGPTRQTIAYLSDVSGVAEYANWKLVVGSTTKTVLSTEYVKFIGSGGASCNISGTGSSGDPYLVTITGVNQSISLTGDVTGSGTTSIATTIANDAVEYNMLNDNIISGQTALTSGLVSTDEILISDGGVLKRMDVSLLSGVMTHDLLSSTHSDTTAGSAALGDLIVGQGSPVTWKKFAVGTSGQVLMVNGSSNGYIWSTPSGTYSWTVAGDTGSEAVSSGSTITFSGSTAITTAYNSSTNILTITHADTSPLSASSPINQNNSGGTVIQDIAVTIDTYGHITAASASTVNLDSRYIQGTGIANRVAVWGSSTALTYGVLYDDSTRASAGAAPDSNSQFYSVTSSLTNALKVLNSKASGVGTYTEVSGSTGSKYALYATASSSGVNYAGYFTASGGSTNYGVYIANGYLGISGITNATTDTNTFLVADGVVVKYRTGSELLSDINAIGSPGSSTDDTIATWNGVSGNALQSTKVYVYTSGSDEIIGISKSASGNVVIKDTVGGNSSALFDPTGHVILYYNGSEILETFATGLEVTGKIAASDDIEIYSSLSDITLKDTIQPLKKGLDVVRKLNPVTYRSLYKSHFGEFHTGLIANEVEELIPCAVWRRMDGYLGLRDERITPYLIKAIQESDLEIKRLKKRILELEKR